jgi:hypothetical protein
LNHRTSDVTQGYVQFDLEQLRCAMQAVEDFVLEQVGTAVQKSETTQPANDLGRTGVMKEENPQSLVNGISHSAHLL